MNVNEIATFFLLSEYSDDNFGQPADWDGSAETYDPDYETKERTPAQMLNHAQNFVDAMDQIYPRITGMTEAENIMSVFYDVGKALYGPKSLRSFFRDFYWMLTGKCDGARIGVFIAIFGVPQFKERMQMRLNNPMAAF